MTTPDETRSKSFTLGVEVWKRLKEEGNASQLARNLFREYYLHGRSREAAMEVRERDLRQEKRNVRLEITKLESRLEEIDAELDEIENRRSAYSDTEMEQIQRMVGIIEDNRFDTSNLTTDNPAVQNRASQAGMEPDRFVNAVREELANG